jgi:hypothetical protein
VSTYIKGRIRSPKKREFLSEFDAAESAYLAGMRDVLQQLAIKRFLELLGPSSANPDIVRASHASHEAYNRLHEIFDEENLKETFNFEQVLNEQLWFVRGGYLEGYWFVKELQKPPTTLKNPTS